MCALVFATCLWRSRAIRSWLRPAVAVAADAKASAANVDDVAPLVDATSLLSDDLNDSNRNESVARTPDAERAALQREADRWRTSGDVDYSVFVK